MMRSYILFDDQHRDNLLPLTFTRPVAEIRVGILTIREKWERFLNVSCTHLTADYLSEKYPASAEANEYCLINARFLPNLSVAVQVAELKPGQALLANGMPIACVLNSQPTPRWKPAIEDFPEKIVVDEELTEISHTWDIFKHNDKALREDFRQLTQGRKSGPISSTNQVFKAENIFIEAGAKVECAILNADTGPIYIGASAEVMEGSIIRGPFALCEGSTLKLGAKIYGPTTIGPFSKVGGEVNNCVIFGNSNKAHEGFLGNSVIGEWCNLGADTNNSNLKNNYAAVKVWNYAQRKFINSGLQFCGLIMGDHSKCGINTMFNTGTVVGVSANIFGSGFPRNFIPSFSWGGAHGFSTYQPAKVFETAELVMKRRGIQLSEIDKRILLKVFEITSEFRKFQ